MQKPADNLILAKIRILTDYLLLLGIGKKLRDFQLDLI